jgi:predicted nucleic acid-binding protein
MSDFFLDTSAIVKRYSPEAGSDWIKAITDIIAGHDITLAEITLAEVAAAFAAKARAPGGITIEERDQALADFLRDCDEHYDLLSISREVIDLAVSLTQRHKLRGYDAVQLAGALIVNTELLAEGLPSLTFVSADEDLVEAAEAEGLLTENPNLYV